MIMPVLDDDMVRSTGGQVDDLTMALIDSAYDKDGDCQEQICNALFDLGRRKPALVLSSCYAYLKKHSKLSQGHRVVLLQTMEKIIKENLDDIDTGLAVDVIKQGALELTLSKEVVPEWQTAASGMLVAIGTKYCDEVMDEMLQRFMPGVLPHFFVVQTMGNLAQANVYRMVPHLTAVLGTMLPMLGMAKHDNMRWVFTTALSKFSEAIVDYCANIDKAPDPSVSKDRFSQEIASAFDVLFNSWLQSKEMKLRLAIVEALGHMTHLMATEKLEEQLPKMIQGMLGLYKRHPEPFHITQGLCSVLDAVCTEGNTILEPQLEQILACLFPQIFAPLDYKNPMSIKNHNEVLRCFAILARSFSGKLTGILLAKLDNNNEKIRIGILTIFKHLINAATDSMEDKQEVVVSGLKSMTQESNNKIKKIFAQVVIAMAHHGYLELEGGQQMIEFIVRQCSLQNDPPGKKSTDPEYVSNQSLRMMCDNVLQLLTTTVEDMEPVLWPYLLELLVPEKYTEATGVVCRCLGHLSNKKREENADDYDIDFDTQANIPKPPALIARLMVLAGRPTNGRERGVHVLQAMKGLSPNLNENLVDIWDTVTPKLIQYLEDATREDKFSQQNWEDLLLKMLSKSLDIVENEDWIAELGEMFGSHIPMYNNYSDEKNFLYKCLGVVMRKSSKKDFVTKHLELVFSTVKHTDQVEREGCAIAMGFCAASHLDAVLTKLESVAKNDMVQKSSGLFSFIKDKSEVDVERTKATLMLCYGFVALFSPPSLIVSRMEATILRGIQPHFANVKGDTKDLKICLIRTIDLIGRTLSSKKLKLHFKFTQKAEFLAHLQDTSVKQNLIRTVDLIGKSLHTDHLKSEYNFSNRGEFLTHLQSYMSAESTGSITNETRALSMKSCATLVKLEPKLSDAENFDLVKTATDCVYPLPKDGMAVKKGKEDSYDQQLECEVLLESTIEAMHDLLKEILLKDLTPKGLDNVFKHTSKWFLSLEEHERQRSLQTLLICEEFLLENMDSSTEDVGAFDQESTILAKLVPRCSDPDTKVRQLAVDCIQGVLRIASRIDGNPSDHKDQMIEALSTLKERLEKGDPTILFSVINDLSKVIVKKLPSSQLLNFLEVLQEGLLDPQSHSSSGACVVLNSLMKARGAEVLKTVGNIVKTLHEKLGQIEFDQTKTGTLRTIRTLATHHLSRVVDTLLNFPLPYDENCVEIWKILSQDAQLTSSILDLLLEILQRTLPYEEKPDGDSTVKHATTIPLAVTCAMTVIFGEEETEDQVLKNYHRLMAALMIRVGSSVGVKPLKQKSAPQSSFMQRFRGQISPQTLVLDEIHRRGIPYMLNVTNRACLSISQQDTLDKEEKPKDKKKGSILSSGPKVPTCSQSAIEAFKMFLVRTKTTDLQELLEEEDCWTKFDDEDDFPEAFTILTRGLVESTVASKHISKIVASLTSTLSSLYDPQRIVVASFFAELINQKCAGDTTLIELVMNSLLGRLVDSSHVVRMLCIKGLGNISSIGKEQVQRYSTTVLSAMMAGMDDKEDPDDDITIQAMSGLSNILPEIDESHIRAILINVALRIRPCFEKDKTAVRSQAFILFGNLSRFGDGPSKAPFLEQIHSNLVSLLLHLNDPENDVKKACKFSLRLLGELMESEDVNNKFQKHLLEDRNLIYGEFLNDLAKLIIKDFPDKVNFYAMGCVSFFKSMWPEIKSNAALFVGYLLGNLTKEKHQMISKEHICAALIILLKDPTPEVRSRAAEAMSLLYDY